MTIEEIDSEEERQTRVKKKKKKKNETLGMEDMEINKPHASASSGARGSTDQILQPDGDVDGAALNT